MDIDGNLPPEEPATVFFIGQHETGREAPLSVDTLAQAQSLGYDFVTTPLTTASFHQRLVSQLQAHLSGSNELLPLISPLSPADTSLAPNASNSALMGIVSPWIDLASPDPIIAHASRQVLSMEVAFAAFCGISNVIIHGPDSEGEVKQYSRAIAEALGLGPYIQVHVLLPMSGDLEADCGDATHLSELARPAFINNEDDVSETDDAYSSWEIWSTLQSICSYSQKLSLGKYLHLVHLHLANDETTFFDTIVASHHTLWVGIHTERRFKKFTH